jgi:hypothetical protein
MKVSMAFMIALGQRHWCLLRIFAQEWSAFVALVYYTRSWLILLSDVLGTLVRLAEPDRPSGIQAEVLRTVQNMVVLMDEQFLVHSAVHRAVLRLLRNCVGDDIQEQLDGRNRVMGAAKNAIRSEPSDYELDRECLYCP